MIFFRYPKYDPAKEYLLRTANFAERLSKNMEKRVKIFNDFPNNQGAK